MGLIDFLRGLWAIQPDIAPIHLISDAAACLDSAGLCWEQGGPCKKQCGALVRLCVF